MTQDQGEKCGQNNWVIKHQEVRYKPKNVQGKTAQMSCVENRVDHRNSTGSIIPGDEDKPGQKVKDTMVTETHRGWGN